jgi:hypothetical protein
VVFGGGVQIAVGAAASVSAADVVGGTLVV